LADLLSLNDVSKSYTAITGEVVEAIRGVSFDLHEREVLTLVGPSGCGKSTILRLIAGVEKPSSGSIERRAAGGKFVVGYIFQDSSLMRWRTVYGNIKLPMEILGKKGAEAKISELVKLINLEGFENAYPIELSGGMQRRVAVARALVHDPSVLLMDEPFTGVDEITKEILQTELNFVIRSLKMTGVLVTHDIDEAVYLGDRILVLSAHPGRIVEEISVDLPEIREPVIKTEERFTRYTKEIREKLNLLHPLRLSRRPANAPA